MSKNIPHKSIRHEKANDDRGMFFSGTRRTTYSTSSS